ncbi:MAG: gamma-glutamyl-gamma-aminobutyrate hydrolase family protein [Planctomycetota bacterium]
MDTDRPLIGITADATGDDYRIKRTLAAAVETAGGQPVILPCRPALAATYAARLDGFVLSGGDDPAMEPWGEPTHPKATPIDPERQAFEVALLEALDARPAVPVLGVCLGMQLMGLHAGGTLDQHLPDTLATAADHWGRRVHEIDGALGRGRVHSHHRQAITDPGRLRVAAAAPDGVIEAIRDDERAFYVGVQWHPERTDDANLGIDLFRGLVAQAGRAIGPAPSGVGA